MAVVGPRPRSEDALLSPKSVPLAAVLAPDENLAGFRTAEAVNGYGARTAGSRARAERARPLERVGSSGQARGAVHSDP